MKIAVVGATGYLGRYLVKELNRLNISPTIITRRWSYYERENLRTKEVVKVDFRDVTTLSGKLKDIDVVVSSLGITRQKDNLTYMDVDYQVNLNLLEEAKRCGVKKFVYISALHGQNLRNTKIFEAKEKFVDALKGSGLDYLVIRPCGFFSDMKDFLDMAKSGRVYLFGDGDKKLNPIHGADLAQFCIQAIDTFNNEEVEVGGPKVYTHTQLAHLALDKLGKNRNITYIPDFFRKLTLWVLPYVCKVQTYGPIEFFLTVMDMDMVAAKYGKHSLEEFFEKQSKQI
jgi:uncharacterized protein YbjT (DUF2867 family)